MRDDKKLQQLVLDELDYEPSVNAEHIGVTARDGIVTLTGHVTNYAEKLGAEQAARRVYGVKAVAQEIEVRLPLEKKTADDEIAKRAVDILAWDAVVPTNRIAVKVEHGWVTLQGELDWQYQKAAAEADVRKLTGVRGVINIINVRSSMPAARATEVKQKIEAAFKRNAETEAAHIHVLVADGKVTLGGRVNAWYERDVAERAAWSAPGVTAVDDRIIIGPQ